MVEKRNIDEVKSLKINLVSPDKMNGLVGKYIILKH